ncbi:MAG TPA: YceI family protein [Anaeromyxobacter sp.]
MKRILALFLAVAAPAAALAQTSTWSIDPAHSRAGFSIRHLVISNVRGDFQKLSGAVQLDEKDVSRSSVEATLETASVDTGMPDRDKHLRSPDFFDAERFPTITFKSTKVAKAAGGKLAVTGNLTMKGVTRPIVLAVEGPTAEIKDPMGNVRRGLSASATINRKDWGLTWSKTVEAGPVVGDEVKIEIEAELVKQAAAKTAAK